MKSHVLARGSASRRIRPLFKTPRRPTRRREVHDLEALEDRRLLSTFAVTNRLNSGEGSLRWAMTSANDRPGTDTIEFRVAGTIRVAGRSLPALTGTVTLDGSTAPSFAGTPVVTIDFGGTRGLRFEGGSDGSSLTSLVLIRAGNAGVTLNASHVTVQQNWIGLGADGRVAGNRGDGIRINASSQGNLIGHSDPVSRVRYDNADSVSPGPVTAWQGIRNGDIRGRYLIAGTSGTNGLLYVGPISGVGGTSYDVNVPGATSSSVYGPNLLPDGSIQLVGSYKNGTDTVNGFLYQGTTADLSDAANYTTIDYPGAQYTYVHSVMGGLAVGNADGPEGDAPLGTGHAFLYNIAAGTLSDIVYPGATTTTAYGIWDNGRSSLTIVGGYSAPGDVGDGLSHGYMVDYDASTGEYSHWSSFDYPNGVVGKDYITHFEGISSDEKGVYTLVADSVQRGTANPAQGSWVSVRRNTDGSFGNGRWVDLNAPGASSPSISSANSVAGNVVVGLVIGASGTAPYQAEVQTSFQLSNVISGNGGNGIGIYGSSHNQVAMNFIGTDASGSFRRGNAKHGILITNGATDNLIGGEATGGNDPTGGVIVRPPQGNLISGNGGDGVRITGAAGRNQLSGNFVGTSASGLSALGNRGDGVAIVKADGNSLLGCTFQQDPFVFYNVISGNGGNGLRITDSDDTTVQANFLGVGADNASIVANKGDGLLVSGTSANTQVGGVIPLGNVIAGNDRNGIEVRDRASGFVSFNTFAGLFAFSTAAPNRKDGILITSTGGNNLIRTCIVSGNLRHGIEITGRATGVQVTETAIGTNTNINAALPNGGDGILIAGSAHGNAIGGFQPSIEPQVTVSSNRGYGIEIAGRARDNRIVHTRIGTSALGTNRLGNALGGIVLRPGTSSTRIGGASAALANLIRYNRGNGVTWMSTRSASLEGNTIAQNLGYGLRATGNCAGSTLQANTILDNEGGNVNLTGSRGIHVSA
ncbi:beta strand repeat-containing protein [Aquisphaera insulae]|uniref:beta strand repeat-containing protein n=1 Tax=Aquisphaera insulae TaxID=2712864 RepID=UPI0013ECA1BF|nr:right-handed parallel beta-helix repeat-containing protein [Aquisphaera insulae]